MFSVAVFGTSDSVACANTSTYSVSIFARNTICFSKPTSTRSAKREGQCIRSTPSERISPSPCTWEWLQRLSTSAAMSGALVRNMLR